MPLMLLVLLGCGSTQPDTAPPPGPLEVGVSRVRMPVPVGIGTVGYGGFDITSRPSPFAQIYPATEHVHQHPDFRVVALSRGEGHEVVIVRTDTVGVFQELRRAVVLELEERLGRDLDDVLVMGATHTHSGPGRVIDAGGPFDLIADVFFPEFYEGMVNAIADGVEAAYADLRPGRLGVTWTDGSDALHDRRCEDGGPDHVNGALPILAVEQEGALRALVLTLPIHGTVLGIDQLTLSSDVSGAIEGAVEDRLDTPVEVMLLNAWGGDMSPGSPEVSLQSGAVLPDGYQQMASVGQHVADEVEEALPALEWDDRPTLALRTFRATIGRAELEYPDGEFVHEYGAVYCGLGQTHDCDASTREDSLDEVCIPFPEEFPAPEQTLITAGRVGPLHLVTFPGESGTALAESIVADLKAELGIERVWFVGYSQDYLGYSLLEEDWWQGGYEASGALWGPKQGEYLARQTLLASAIAIGDLPDLAVAQPAPIAPFADRDFEPYVPTFAPRAGEVLEDVVSTVGPTDVITFTVAGLDPWLGTPVATLETAGGDVVLRPGGQPLNSDGAAFWVTLEPDPPYDDGLDLVARTFRWRFSIPAAHPVVGAMPVLSGAHRLRVVLPDGGEVTSGVVTITGS